MSQSTGGPHPTQERFSFSTKILFSGMFFGGLAIVVIAVVLNSMTLGDLMFMSRPMLEVATSRSPSGRWTLTVVQGDPRIYAERRVAVLAQREGSSERMTVKSLQFERGGGTLKNGKCLITWETVQSREVALLELVSIHGERLSFRLDPEDR